MTDEFSLPVAAVARRLGVAPATLRTWARRYGLEPSGHVPGRHRRYTGDDLARLEVMHQALARGTGPAEAARLALATPAAAPRSLLAITPPPAPVTLTVEEPEEVSDDVGSRSRGGRVLRLPGATPRARGLARAAFAMDTEAVRTVLLESLTAEGLVRTWEHVALPVLVAVAQRWESIGRGVEIEHLVSDCVAMVYNARAVLSPAQPGLRPILLAGMPGEHHVLPLTVLSAVLAERGMPCRPLGADLPADALVDAIRRTAPAAVMLWAQVPGTADPDVLAGLPRTRPRHRVFVGGGGWDPHILPSTVSLLSTLEGAADVLTRVVTG